MGYRFYVFIFCFCFLCNDAVSAQSTITFKDDTTKIYWSDGSIRWSQIKGITRSNVNKTKIHIDSRANKLKIQLHDTVFRAVAFGGLYINPLKSKIRYTGDTGATLLYCQTLLDYYQFFPRGTEGLLGYNIGGIIYGDTSEKYRNSIHFFRWGRHRNYTNFFEVRDKKAKWFINLSRHGMDTALVRYYANGLRREIQPDEMPGGNAPRLQQLQVARADTAFKTGKVGIGFFGGGGTVVPIGGFNHYFSASGMVNFGMEVSARNVFYILNISLGFCHANQSFSYQDELWHKNQQTQISLVNVGMGYMTLDNKRFRMVPYGAIGFSSFEHDTSDSTSTGIYNLNVAAGFTADIKTRKFIKTSPGGFNGFSFDGLQANIFLSKACFMPFSSGYTINCALRMHAWGF